ncbi:His-Xaa-Ser system radical SAM maturase HxsC [Mycobacterium alsense]|uniref:His-Xaa-Ser system radical SAM maturase HxsC n=1 Tax=Mycobacterium alsense TaxID=324058 RepID=A0AA41XS75_9MYCO|nr:His-Xaa-Ser system radical SAM maturase HxsC [Mycobacterium alsense]MCV7380928.1 His-Xaa-Ser system radical SAM maturase HxsC [Mycobacterium alsense]OQZ90574.1 His-Xaa-Ser system radical SAM maturase HxsC [Mycobacterium alsense]
MGAVKPLILSGRAAAADIARLGTERQSWRLRSPVYFPSCQRDAALIASHDDWELAQAHGYELAIAREERPVQASLSYLRLATEFAELHDGDVVRIHPETRRVRVLYRRSSKHNFFLVTERCNNYCLMCSQPPKSVDDGWLIDEIEETLPLVDPQTTSLTFTGGEPLTDWRRFIGLLSLTRDLLPDTAVHVLTNGRAFASSEVVSAWAAVGHRKLSAGIPIYAAIDHVHDYVVQAKGAFDQTVLGILRLKDCGQRVEIRVVLHAITAPRLRETCVWLARNLPFVDHVALMGLENTGFAIANDEILWMDPIDYQVQLADSIEILSCAGFNVSVYNLPLCVLDPSVRPFAVQSISDWKNAYVAECESCSVRADCAGFFSTGRPKFSRGIAAI